MMEPIDDARLGDLVLRENFLSEEELLACITLCNESDPPRSLSEVMIQKRFITSAQLNRILDKSITRVSDSSNSRDRFGEVAIRKGFVTREQLQECLEEQKSGKEAGRHLRLGQILMQRRLLSTQQFLEVLKAQEQMSLACVSCGEVFLQGELDSSGGDNSNCNACGSPFSGESAPPSPPPPSGEVSKMPESDIVTLCTPRPEMVEDRYRIVQQLGQSPRTVAYQAYDRSRGEIVVLKVVRQEEAGSGFANRLLSEAEGMKKNGHPCLIPVLDSGLRDGCAYFTMAFEEGRSLERRIRERGISSLDAARTMKEIASSCEALHAKGIYHGNIKASNILFTRDEDVRFSDLGLQQGLSDYVAPERVGNARGVSDIRGDIYSLGVVLYEMLTGRLPFEGVPPESLDKAIMTRVPRPPREVNEGSPIDLQAICLRAMEKDPLMRYGSAQELAGDLRRFLEGEPVQSRRGSTVAKVVWGVTGGLWGGSAYLVKWVIGAILLLVLPTGYFLLTRDWGASPDFDPASEQLRRLEAEPHFIEAQGSLDDAGLLTSSLAELERMLQANAFYLHAVSRSCEGQAREQLRSAANDYSEAFKRIRAGGVGKETVREQMRSAEQKISDVRGNTETLPPDVARQLREIEERNRKAMRQWQRVPVWPADVMENLLSSMAEVEKALALDPEYAEAFLLRGRVLHRLWRLEEAAAAFEKALLLPEAEQLPELDFEYASFLFSRWALSQGDPLVILNSEGSRLSLAPGKQPIKLIEKHLRNYLGHGSELPRKNRLLSRAMLEIIGAEISRKDRVNPFLPEEIFGEKGGTPSAYRTLGFLYLKRKEIRRSCENLFLAVNLDRLLPRTSIEDLSLYPRPALAFLLSSIESVPQPTSATRFNRATVLRALGDEEGARKEIGELLRADSGFTPARVGWIRMNLEAAERFTKGAAPTGKRLREARKSALDYCEEALKKDPGNTEVRTLRVEMLLAFGQGGGLSGEIAALLRERTGDPLLLYLDAQNHLSQGASDRSMRSAKRALQAVPSFALAHEIRARSRFHVRDFLGAREDVNRALELHPGLVSAYITRARISTFQPRSDPVSGERDLAEAQKRDPGNADAWYWQGEILDWKTRANISSEKKVSLLRKSLADYEEAIRVDPGHANAHVMRAVRRMQLGFSRSGRELDELISKFPECGLGYFWLGNYHSQTGKYEAAIKDWDRARKLLPHKREVIRDLVRRARAQLVKARQLPEWLKGIQKGHEQVMKNDYEKAWIEYSKVVGILPKKLPSNGEHLNWLVLFSYNYACVLSVHSKSVGEKEKEELQAQALYWLETASRIGWRNWPDRCHISAVEHMRQDPDLKGLHRFTRFKRLLGYSEE